MPLAAMQIEALDRTEIFFGLCDERLFAAALQAEVMAVLAGCGIAAGNATNRQRKAVFHALGARLESVGESVDHAGNFAVQQWRLYLRQSEGLLLKAGVQRFFASGMWLQSWTCAAYAPRPGRSEASVGMRRVK